MPSTEEGGGAVGAVSTDQTIIDNNTNNDYVGIDMWFTDVPLSNGEVANFRSLYEAFYVGQPNFTAKPLIRKVPSALRRNEDFKKYFMPRVISIGPLHHDDPTLIESKELKLKLAAHFVNKVGVDGESLYSNIKKEMDGLRKCYDPQAWMFFVDGCAILQAIYMRYDTYDDDDDMTQNGKKFMKAIKRFIDDTVINPGEERFWCSEWWWEQQKEGERIHLLHLLRERLLVKEEKPWWWRLLPVEEGKPRWWRFIESRFINEARSKRYHSRTIGTVKELKKAGITLQASETSCLTDISFNHFFFFGKLRLPPIIVDDSTINLIAYEMCPDFHNDFTVTSYMCFLDLLIDEAEDVKDLRDAGILYNRLGSDEEVAKLFNKMNTDLVPSPIIYSGVKEKIHNHCKNMWINHAAECYLTYFRSPWTFLAVLGSIASLTLTALQTYYATHQQK
ncbi:hypothetical protein E1A91_D11G369400v1 [Gossypium mustelinum]|uniref:Uncharacterized protein n=1 Tax=Gossypium mustelinum TaxID=34275 RepID=A0A5D2T370_GOSMU|nr:hypothetical protein E1A91_D11G369400v1 [Gossypium mustelinum]